MNYTLSKKELFTLLECMRYASDNDFLDECDAEVRADAADTMAELSARFSGINWAEV